MAKASSSGSQPVLTEAQARAFVAMPKRVILPSKPFVFAPKCAEYIDVQSTDGQHGFRLYVTLSDRRPGHAKFQFLAPNDATIHRLEDAGPDHKNPDRQVIPCPHLHYVKNGYRSDEWAEHVGNRFGDPAHLPTCFFGFLSYLNVCHAFELQGRLFV